MANKRGVKSVNGRRPKKLSTHAEDDQKRRRSRLNITIGAEVRKLLGELGPTRTSLGTVGQTSSNIEAGVRLVYFLSCGGNADEVAFNLVELCGDVSRFKEDGSAYTRMSDLVARIKALGESTERVVASRAESKISDGSVVLTKGKL